METFGFQNIRKTKSFSGLWKFKVFPKHLNTHFQFGVVMGRIKTSFIKRITLKIYKEHTDDFKKDFEENKKIVEKHLEIPSKKLRNTIAGYVTRLAKTKEEI